MIICVEGMHIIAHVTARENFVLLVFSFRLYVLDKDIV